MPGLLLDFWFDISYMILNTNVVFLQKVGIQLVRQSLDQAQLGWIEIQTEYENAISNQKFVLEFFFLYYSRGRWRGNFESGQICIK